MQVLEVSRVSTDGRPVVWVDSALKIKALTLFDMKLKELTLLISTSLAISLISHIPVKTTSGYFMSKSVIERFIAYESLSLSTVDLCLITGLF